MTHIMLSVAFAAALVLSDAIVTPIPLISMDDVPCIELNGHGAAFDKSIIKLAIENGASSGLTLEFYKASSAKDQGQTNYVFSIVGPRYRDDVYWVYTINNETAQFIHKFEYYSLHGVCGWTGARKA